MEDTDEEELTISPRQLKRQFDRIKQNLFDDYEELEDDSYRGNLKPEVRAIFDNNIVIGHIMDESDLDFLVTRLITEVVEYIVEKVKGVDSKIATVFAYDFVTQCLEVVFTLEVTDTEPEFDPAFG